MDKDTFLLLTTKVLSNNASQQEKEQIALIVETDPELHELFEQYKAFWGQKIESQANILEAALKNTWEKINLNKE